MTDWVEQVWGMLFLWSLVGGFLGKEGMPGTRSNQLSKSTHPVCEGLTSQHGWLAVLCRLERVEKAREVLSEVVA